MRRLPVGDGIWIAREKQLDSEYVLDFIVERKGVDDLRCSIRDNRYKDQKLRLLVLNLILLWLYFTVCVLRTFVAYLLFFVFVFFLFPIVVTVFFIII